MKKTIGPSFSFGAKKGKPKGLRSGQESPEMKKTGETLRVRRGAHLK